VSDADSQRVSTRRHAGGLIRALPNEGCGLLLGTGEGLVHEVIASLNIADSAKVYEIEPTVLLRASRRADAKVWR